MPNDTPKNLLKPEKLLIALKASGLGLWEMNIQSGKGTVDKKWAEMLGYRLDEVNSSMEFWNSNVHPDDKARALKKLNTCLSGKSTTYSSEYRLRTKDGHWKWILDRGQITEWDKDGRPLLLVGTHKDISERKLDKETLTQERNKLEAVISALGDGLTVQDRDFKIIYQNAVQKQRQGAHEGDFCYNAYQNKSEVCDGCLIEKCFRDGQIHRRETSSISPDGRDIFMEVSASPIKDSQGNIIAGVETVRDITQRKLLANQLQQAQKLEAIGTLAGGIAHDFNNILFVIYGYAELVQLQLPKDSKLWEMQNQIISASTRAKELVQQILSFSRREGRELKPLILTSIIKEALKMLRASIPTTIKFKENIETQTGTVLADPTQIHQIIMNLCTNAYHAMRETGGILSVGLKNVTVDDRDIKSIGLKIPSGQYVCLTVGDTGHGINKKIQGLIFDPYFTTKKKGEGTGLGLAIVHGIIQSYGGCITIYSEPNKGTAFNVYIPQTAPPSTRQNKQGSTDLPRGNEHILVVDDEEQIVNLEKETLKGLGYQVSAITSCEKTLELFSSAPKAFDLIITDMTMPTMTGLELSSKILAIRPDIPIILCTGFSNLIDEQKASNAGIRKLLVKPVSREELAHAVRKTLDSSPQ
nr:PAS domain-containing protein [Desulfobulbaceae bacterium]